MGEADGQPKAGLGHKFKKKRVFGPKLGPSVCDYNHHHACRSAV